jgi:hypothetical protein
LEDQKLVSQLSRYAEDGPANGELIDCLGFCDLDRSMTALE